MLQGTFETLSLPEVLGLLSSARKSGALWLDAGPISGVVHLEDGHCEATEAGELRGPVDSGTALLNRLIEVCFAVMRQDTGSFRFAADEPPPWSCAERVELSDALVEVDRLLKQWKEILRVIPSLECRPRLLDALEVDEIILDRQRWGLLVALDGRRTVRELIQRTGRPVMDVCHELLELIEAGAVGVIDPAAARPPETNAVDRALPEEPADRAVVVPPAPPPTYEPGQYEPGHAPGQHEPVPVEAHAAAVNAPATLTAVADPEPADADEPVAAVIPLTPATEVAPVEAPAAAPPRAAVEPDGHDPATEHADKGAFLRLFSGLRES